MGYPAGGSGGGEQKNYWGINLSPKMIVLQGVRHPIPLLGVCYTNDPQNGACGPALDLTALFEVIFPHPAKEHIEEALQGRKG